MILNIALDLDGCFSNFHYEFSKVANRLFVSPIVKDINDVKAYCWEDWGYPLDKKQHNKVWREIDTNINDFWLNLEPLVENVIFEKMKKMEKENYNFFFITSRKNTSGGSALSQTK